MTLLLDTTAVFQVFRDNTDTFHDNTDTFHNNIDACCDDIDAFHKKQIHHYSTSRWHDLLPATTTQ